MSFSVKIPTDTETFSFTVANDGLSTGVTITGSSWAIVVYHGTEVTPTLITVGVPVVTGLIISQKLTGGTLGITYMIECTYTTSDGQTITKYDTVLVNNASV